MFFSTPSATEMLMQSWKWHFGGMLGARAPSAQNKMRRMTRRVFLRAAVARARPVSA